MAAPSAAAAAGAAAAALLQRQLLQGSGEGWSEHQTGDGRKFFHNEETGVSQWEKPESLMSESERLINADEWKQYRIWDGRIFYHNKETKVSCWSMPPELRKLKGESTGLDDRPLAETNAERRQAFQEFLKEQGIDATWDWRKVQSLLPKAGPSAQSLSEGLQKQVFAELLSMELRKKELQARRKARNAAVALERLLEERFGEPDALGTSYQEAATILGDEEAWILIKSDVRREEVFQNVMERLEEKHQNARAEQRTVATLRERAEHVTESKQEAFRGPEPGPSQGSYGHPHLCRRPCVKFARGCCDKGVACGFCHSDHVKPATFDKQARDWLAAWPKGRVIAAVLPLLHRAAVKECSAMDLLEILQREHTIRGTGQPQPRTPRKIQQVLDRMNFAGLIGVVRSHVGGHLAILLENGLKNLREEASLLCQPLIEGMERTEDLLSFLTSKIEVAQSCAAEEPSAVRPILRSKRAFPEISTQQLPKWSPCLADRGTTGFCSKKPRRAAWGVHDDACAVLARRDELQEEDPPIEALKVWSSMRELRLATVKDPDLKSKVQSQYYHDERKRRDAFVLAMKELAAAERFTVDTSWAQLEEMLQFDQRLQGMREGEGATGMELFDEFIEELKLKGPEAYAGVEPAPPPVVQEPPAKRRRPNRLSEPTIPVKQEFHAVKMEKEEDEDETNALDALIAAAKTEPKTEAREEPKKPPMPPMPKAVKMETVKTEPQVKAEDDTEEEEEDPLMGAALKAQRVKEELE
ncbi:unnamed protein product [Durusdinium trenchii]|uniref:Uncharacterized protein n=1 Tax=Durusdinium trenchii TaxID=1381693 RepID=A0ABP0PS11_9DINO